MRRITIFISLLLFCVVAAKAQKTIEPPTPTALVIDAKGEETNLVVGGDYSGPAPITVEFSANAPEEEGFTLSYLWEFFREGESERYLARREANFKIDLRESGTITVKPKITYTSIENSEIYWPFDDEVYQPFTISLNPSKLEVPNAFSPNGDGTNDYFNVINPESIIEFNGAIYNRWGQELYRWGIDEIGCENCGWDGTYKGNPVKDGVYFVVIRAKGADGIVYEIKRDVNLLRGYSEGIK